MRLARVLAMSIDLALAAGSAKAERLVSTLSNDTVQITSSFDGETLSLFGNIEPEAGSAQQFVSGDARFVKRNTR